MTLPDTLTQAQRDYALATLGGDQGQILSALKSLRRAEQEVRQERNITRAFNLGFNP